MSWQFDKPLIKIINGTTYNVALCMSASDFSATTYYKQLLNSETFYSPLSSSSSGSYTSAYKKIINSTTYYPHLNKCKVSVTYSRTTSNPTSGVTNYTWTIKKIVLEMPLPVATGGSLSLSANIKEKSGTLLQKTQSNNSTFTFSLSASRNGKTVSGSARLTSGGTAEFYLS